MNTKEKSPKKRFGLIVLVLAGLTLLVVSLSACTEHGLLCIFC